ncbi:MAG: S41 family peptidase, partial [Patescibacteria group bacterium]
MKSNNVTNFLLYCSIGIFIFWMGAQFGKAQARGGGSLFHAISAENESNNLDMSLFNSTMKTLQEKYVDKSKFDTKKMLYGAIKGMVASLEDPYTYFLTPEENKQTKNQLAGKLEGIGAMLEMKDGNVTIISTLKDSPAQKAGLRPGDIIAKVNNKAVKGLVLPKIVEQIRGPKGTKVSLTVVRANKELPFTITRDEVQTNSLDLSYVQDVALMQLHQFGDTTNDEWDTAVSEVRQKYDNGEIKGIVLDLRNNPGGYLQSAVYLTSDFIDKDKLVVKQESANDSIPYMTFPTQRLIDIPVTVLINRYSASAAEILSGALKDYDRAVIVGEKSFGKGSVQEALELQGDAGLHVTVAKWIMPKGAWIHGKGIEPN